MVPRNWIDSMDIPSVTCEYTEEQWERIQEMKGNLECLARELELILQ